MNYKLDITLTDKDYTDFNIFWMLKSTYGKKQMLKCRVIIFLIFALSALFVLLTGDGSVGNFVFIGLMVVMLALFQIFMPSFYTRTIKSQLKTLKKSGKMAYSPESSMEFYDDYFVEYTEENKNEHKYTTIERISLVGDKIIYLHINNVTAYLIPISSFNSEEELSSFIDFIKTKAPIVDIY